MVDLVRAADDEPLAWTATGSDGTFSMNGIPANEVVSIVAIAPGFVKGVSTVLARVEEPVAPLQITLEVASLAVGRVLGPDGRPARGANVNAIPAGPGARDREPAETRLGPYGTGLEIAATGYANENGEYSLDGLKPEVAYRVFAQHAGFARSSLSDVFAGPPAGSRVRLDDLRLRYASGIRAVLLLESGAPAMDARAFLLVAERRVEPGRYDPPATAVFESLPAGEYLVTAVRSGLATAIERIALRDGQVADLRLVMKRGVEVEGVVVDDAGNPIPGAGVSASQVDLGDAVTARFRGSSSIADEDGRFRVSGLEPGPYALTASAAGYGRTSASITLFAPARGARLVIQRPATLRLPLLLPAGVAPPKTIRITVEERDTGSGSAFDRPWNGGDLVLNGLAPGQIRVTVVVDSLAPLVVEERLHPGDDRSMHAQVLSAGVELNGTVRGGAGRPVKGASIRLGLDSAVERGTAVSDVGGNFHLEHLPMSVPLMLAVEAEGFLPMRRMVTLYRSTESITLNLSASIAIQGIVRSLAGGPAVGARVTLSLQEDVPAGIQSVWIVTADENGRFAAVVAQGKYSVDVKSAAGDPGRSVPAFDTASGTMLNLEAP